MITRLLCHCVLDRREIERDFGLESFERTFASAEARLPEMIDDGLVADDRDRIRVTPLGRIFIRNVAMLFDSYLDSKSPDAPKIFSKTL